MLKSNSDLSPRKPSEQNAPKSAQQLRKEYDEAMRKQFPKHTTRAESPRLNQRDFFVKQKASTRYVLQKHYLPSHSHRSLFGGDW